MLGAVGREGCTGSELGVQLQHQALPNRSRLLSSPCPHRSPQESLECELAQKGEAMEALSAQLAKLQEESGTTQVGRGS